MISHGDEYTANEHHARSKQVASYLAFTEKEPRPQDGEDGAELEDGRHISHEAERDGGKSEKWGNACKHDGPAERSPVLS